MCDPPSWSQAPVLCGENSWNENQVAQGRSHMVLTPQQEQGISDELITRAAVEFLQSNRTQAGPWFLAVGVHRPHLPEVVPQRLVDLYPLENITLPPLRTVPRNMPPIATACSGNGGPCQPGYGSMEMWQQYKFNSTHAQRSIPAWFGWDGSINTTMPADMAKTLRQFYYAGVSHTDELFGRLLAALDATGQRNKTIVAVLGDHGWHLDTKGLWCKCTNFEEAVAAPLILSVPGYPGGQQTDAITEHVDLAATLVDAAGLPALPTCPPAPAPQPDTCTEGVSLVPLLANNASVVKKAAFSQWPKWPAQQPDLMGYTIRTPTLRYTEWVKMNYTAAGAFVPDWSQLCAWELYDELHDPLESANVAGDPAYAVSHKLMRARLHAGWRAAAGPGPWPDLPVQGPAQPNIPCF